MGFLRQKGLISGFLESNILKFHKVRNGMKITILSIPLIP
jgi:hypothetical protein